MSIGAIIMLVISILSIWGGLGLALLNLSRNPEKTDDDVIEPAHTL
ncbi:methionine/alanine import family NSS transporter small subunit [Glutamicibacter sp. NPDC087344]